MIYLVLLIFFLILAYKYDYLNHTANKTKWYNFSCLVLILFSGLRNHVGGDTFNYIYNFDHCPNLIEVISNGRLIISELTQPLWFLINSSLKTVVDDFTIVQVFHAILCNVLLFRFIKHTTTKIFTAVAFSYCIFWWNFNFEIMRESLCVVLFLNATLELSKGNVKKYIIICLPALFVHYFSFVIACLGLLMHYLPKKIYLLAIGCVCIAFLLADTSFLIENILAFLAFTGEDLVTIAGEYLYSDDYGFNSLNIFGIIQQCITLLPAIIVLFYFNKQKDKQTETNLMILYILFAIATSKLSICSRFLNYFLPVYVVSVLNFLSDKSHRKGLNYYIILFIFLFQTYTYIDSFYKPAFNDTSTQTYDIRYIPYKSIFQNPDPLRESKYSIR